MGMGEFIILCFLGSVIFWVVQRFLDCAWMLLVTKPIQFFANRLQQLSIKACNALKKHTA